MILFSIERMTLYIGVECPSSFSIQRRECLLYTEKRQGRGQMGEQGVEGQVAEWTGQAVVSSVACCDGYTLDCCDVGPSLYEWYELEGFSIISFFVVCFFDS